MQPERRPPGLGDRLDAVALTCGLAIAFVLATGVIAALVATTTTGAAASPLQQRISLATQGVDVPHALVAVVAAAALSVRRWLGGDEPSGEERISRLVRGAALAVVAFALVGILGSVAWEGDSAHFTLREIGEGTATAALGLLASWLAAPARG